MEIENPEYISLNFLHKPPKVQTAQLEDCHPEACGI